MVLTRTEVKILEMRSGCFSFFLLQKIKLERIYKSTFASIKSTVIARKVIEKMDLWPRIESSRGDHPFTRHIAHHLKNGKEIQKRCFRVLPKGKILWNFFRMTGNSQNFFSKIFQKFQKRERVSRASEPEVVIAETLPVPERYYQNGIYNSKRKRFHRVKSVSSPNLLETALCYDERYFL